MTKTVRSRKVDLMGFIPTRSNLEAALEKMMYVISGTLWIYLLSLGLLVEYGRDSFIFHMPVLK